MRELFVSEGDMVAKGEELMVVESEGQMHVCNPHKSNWLYTAMKISYLISFWISQVVLI